MTAADSLGARRAALLQELRAAAPDRAVELVAVSKKVGVTVLQDALAAGQRVFGENYVQEAQTKWPALRAAYPDLQLRLIGHLQSNKALAAVQLFDRIDTLDRPGLADALAAAMRKTGRPLPVLIEVNQGAEAQKAGCAPGDVPALLAHARAAGLAVHGLLTVPPAAQDPAPHFRALAALADTLNLPVRSMGMSADYQAAARYGATEVRLGTALFGKRA